MKNMVAEFVKICNRADITISLFRDKLSVKDAMLKFAKTI